EGHRGQGQGRRRGSLQGRRAGARPLRQPWPDPQEQSRAPQEPPRRARQGHRLSHCRSTSFRKSRRQPAFLLSRKAPRRHRALLPLPQTVSPFGGEGWGEGEKPCRQRTASPSRGAIRCTSGNSRGARCVAPPPPPPPPGQQQGGGVGEKPRAHPGGGGRVPSPER